MERLELLDDKLRKIKSYDLTMMKYARNFIVLASDTAKPYQMQY